MPTPTPQPTHDRWRDAEGTHLVLFCQVEQIVESPELGPLPSRLYQQGQALGRSLDSLYVRFGDNVVVSLLPQLLRLLPAVPGER